MPDYSEDFRLTGIKALMGKLKKLATAHYILTTGGESLYRSGEEIMTESKETYCPIDTGNLKGTGHVEKPKVTGDDVVMIMGYGGPAVDYAVVVHETDKNYKNGKQWKYLETPLKANQGQILDNLREDFEAELKTLAG